MFFKPPYRYLNTLNSYTKYLINTECFIVRIFSTCFCLLCILRFKFTKPDHIDSDFIYIYSHGSHLLGTDIIYKISAHRNFLKNLPLIDRICHKYFCRIIHMKIIFGRKSRKTANFHIFPLKFAKNYF